MCLFAEATTGSKVLRTVKLLFVFVCIRWPKVFGVVVSSIDWTGPQLALCCCGQGRVQGSKGKCNFFAPCTHHRVVRNTYAGAMRLLRNTYASRCDFAQNLRQPARVIGCAKSVRSEAIQLWNLEMNSLPVKMIRLKQEMNSLKDDSKNKSFVRQPRHNHLLFERSQFQGSKGKR